MAGLRTRRMPIRLASPPYNGYNPHRPQSLPAEEVASIFAKGESLCGVAERYRSGDWQLAKKPATCVIGRFDTSNLVIVILEELPRGQGQTEEEGSAARAQEEEKEGAPRFEGSVLEWQFVEW